MNIFEPVDIDSCFLGKRILITGACGTIGSALCGKLLGEGATVCALDNDENGLFNLKATCGVTEKSSPNLRLFFGDVRDYDRLLEACSGVDYVFHCAALKHVLICENNPIEATSTNVDGVRNLIRATLKSNVDRVVFTSSDKAVNPSSTMGSTKLLGERLIIAANSTVGKRPTRFSVVRFGNVLDSRGSVLEVFSRQLAAGVPFSITDVGMTRFILSTEDASNLCLTACQRMKGGEIFVSNMGVASVLDLAKAVARTTAPNFVEIGTKPGEKLYEELSTIGEASRSYQVDVGIVIVPEILSNLPEENIEYFKKIRATCMLHHKPVRSDKCKLLTLEQLTDFVASQRQSRNDYTAKL